MEDYTVIWEKLKKQGHELAVIVGGGSPARKFIKVAEDLGLNERVQDEIAIYISRIFAHLFLRKLGDLSCRVVPLTIGDAARCFQEGKIVVMGGLEPGMTTDTVAALIVERIRADMLIKATDQSGIYDKDPVKHVGATKLSKLSYEKLWNVLAENKHRAGIHQILDPEAVRKLEKQQMRIVVVNGFKPENILAVVRGEEVGTTIE
jgi:uridylate kinase